MRKLRVWVLLVFACCLSACTSGRPAASEPERPTRPAPAQVGQIRIPEEPLPADIHLPAVYYVFVNGSQIDSFLDNVKFSSRPPMFFRVPNYVGYYVIDENRDCWFVLKTPWKNLGAAVNLYFTSGKYPPSQRLVAPREYPARSYVGHMTPKEILAWGYRLRHETWVLDTWGTPPDDAYEPVIANSVEVNRWEQLPNDNTLRSYWRSVTLPNGRPAMVQEWAPDPGYELLNPPKSRYPKPERPLSRW